MKKTALQIEDDIFSIVKSSNIAAFVNGQTYRDGFRPENSELEDIIVIYSTGNAEIVQKGVVIVNIYVPDINLRGKKVANKARLKAIEVLAGEFIEKHYSGQYLLELSDIVQSFKEEDINQHFVSIRIKYTLLTF